MMIRRCAVLVVCVLLLCTGCAGGRTYYAGVDALAAPDYRLREGDTFCILPYGDGLRADDLRYQEVAEALRPVFARQGMRVVERWQDATCLAFVDFGVGGMRTVQRSMSSPVWGTRMVGGRAVNTVVGVTTDTRTYDIFTRYLRIYAHLRGGGPSSPGMQVWQTAVESCGVSDDFRSVLPALVLALEGRLGGRTQGREYLAVTFPEKGEAVTEAREDVPEAGE